MKIIFASFQAILEGNVKIQIQALKKESEKLGVEVKLFDVQQNYSFNILNTFGLLFLI